MKIAIMQPYFFPYLGYFQLIHAVDKFILYDELTFIKDAWMNRNRIMVKNQSPAHIVVPLEKKSSNKKIKEINIASNKDWRKSILNSLQMNYKKSDYFEEVYPVLEEILNKDYPTLSSINYNCIKEISNHLNITTELSAYPIYNNLEEKLQEECYIENFPNVKLNQNERKVIRVLEIAKVENAEIFINPIGGQELYSKDEFKKNNLQLFFLKMNKIEYPQFSKEFQASLSIIDVLMHNGWKGSTKLLDSYTLI